MRHDVQLALLDRIQRNLDSKTSDLGPGGRIAVDVYRSAERLAAEERVLFRRWPIPIAHSSELKTPGSYLTHDHTGVPIVVTRDAEGVVRAFLNVCRHRGSRLVDERPAANAAASRAQRYEGEAPSGFTPDGGGRVSAPRRECGARKALTCRYHAWTYDLRGRLLPVPQASTFPDLDRTQLGLVPLPVEVRHGLVWVVPSRDGVMPDLAASLGPFDDDLASFGLATHVALRKRTHRAACNWKLVIDAFSEGYHVTSLHAASLARFFHADGVVIDKHGPHLRSLGARKALIEARDTPRERWDVRPWTTPFYGLFPCTVLVFHPDWVSSIVCYPDGVARCIVEHTMLVPEAEANETRAAHWERTFALIDGEVFAKEDLSVAASIQSTMGSGANEEFVIGGLEEGVRHFHASIEAALGE